MRVYRQITTTRNIVYNNKVGEIITEITPIVEPVTLDEVKGQLQMLLDVTEQDSKIDDYIKGERVALENRTGLSLIPKTIEITIENLNGQYTLPYGPVTGPIIITDTDGNTVDQSSYEFSVGSFPQMVSGSGFHYFYTIDGRVLVDNIYSGGPRWTFSYNAGYPTIPADLKLQLLRNVAYAYTHRGDEDQNNSIANSNKRSGWLL